MKPHSLYFFNICVILSYVLDGFLLSSVLFLYHLLKAFFFSLPLYIFLTSHEPKNVKLIICISLMIFFNFPALYTNFIFYVNIFHIHLMLTCLTKREFNYSLQLPSIPLKHFCIELCVNRFIYLSIVFNVIYVLYQYAPFNFL